MNLKPICENTSKTIILFFFKFKNKTRKVKISMQLIECIVYILRKFSETTIIYSNAKEPSDQNVWNYEKYREMPVF